MLCVMKMRNSLSVLNREFNFFFGFFIFSRAGEEDGIGCCEIGQSDLVILKWLTIDQAF